MSLQREGRGGDGRDESTQVIHTEVCLHSRIVDPTVTHCLISDTSSGISIGSTRATSRQSSTEHAGADVVVVVREPPRDIGTCDDSADESKPFPPPPPPPLPPPPPPSEIRFTPRLVVTRFNCDTRFDIALSSSVSTSSHSLQVSLVTLGPLGPIVV